MPHGPQPRRMRYAMPCCDTSYHIESYGSITYDDLSEMAWGQMPTVPPASLSAGHARHRAQPHAIPRVRGAPCVRPMRGRRPIAAVPASSGCSRHLMRLLPVRARRIRRYGAPRALVSRGSACTRCMRSALRVSCYDGRAGVRCLGRRATRVHAVLPVDRWSMHATMARRIWYTLVGVTLFSVIWPRVMAVLKLAADDFTAMKSPEITRIIKIYIRYCMYNSVIISSEVHEEHTKRKSFITGTDEYIEKYTNFLADITNQSHF